MKNVVTHYWNFFRDGLDLYGQDGTKAAEYAAEKIAELSADQELEACILLVEKAHGDGMDLRVTRRPKPLSLKEQALAVLDDCADSIGAVHENALRRALKTLPDEQ